MVGAGALVHSLFPHPRSGPAAPRHPAAATAPLVQRERWIIEPISGVVPRHPIRYAYGNPSENRPLYWSTYADEYYYFGGENQATYITPYIAVPHTPSWLGKPLQP